MPQHPHLPKDQLAHGAYYRGICRNATIARWNATRQVFHHWRHKFGETFLEDIKAPEDEQVYDVFYAQELVEPAERERIPDSALE